MARRKSANRSILRERMTILLVAVCCFIISNSQYFIPSGSDQPSSNLIACAQDAGDEDQDNRTFLDIATDAVVAPFASLVAESTMKLIYEIVGFEEQSIRPRSTVARYPSHFLEVLLERIVAPNAP